MQKSSINLACLQAVLESAANAGDKGQSQWFSPRTFARHLAGALPQSRVRLVDLNCGRGDLLAAALNHTTKACYGLDIEPVQERAPLVPRSFVPLTADLTVAHPALVKVGWIENLFVLNRPLGCCGTLPGSPKQRGPLIARFKAGRVACDSFPVLLAGAESTASGHNLFRCRNVILIAYTWAANLYKQALDRVHRLTSPHDINVYVILCDGTIDGRMESLTDEKQDAAGLVLDGHLLRETPQEVNLADLLAGAYATFANGARTVDETTLQQQWPQLQETLRASQQSWDAGFPSPEEVSNPESIMKKKSPKTKTPKTEVSEPIRFNPLAICTQPSTPITLNSPSAATTASLLAALAGIQHPKANLEKPASITPILPPPVKPILVPVTCKSPPIGLQPSTTRSNSDWRKRSPPLRVLADRLVTRDVS